MSIAVRGGNAAAEAEAVAEIKVVLARRSEMIRVRLHFCILGISTFFY
jgi:hypothetical protein